MVKYEDIARIINHYEGLDLTAWDIMDRLDRDCLIMIMGQSQAMDYMKDDPKNRRCVPIDNFTYLIYEI